MLDDREARQLYRRAFLSPGGTRILAELMEVSDWLHRLEFHHDPRMAERQAGKQDIVNHIFNRLGITGDPMTADLEPIAKALSKVRPWDLEPGTDRQTEADEE